MRVWTIIGLLFTAAILATIPSSPQLTQRGVELKVDQAQAITYGRHRRVTRRAYRRAGYGYGSYYGYSSPSYSSYYAPQPYSSYYGPVSSYAPTTYYPPSYSYYRPPYAGFYGGWR